MRVTERQQKHAPEMQAPVRHSSCACGGSCTTCSQRTTPASSRFARDLTGIRPRSELTGFGNSIAQPEPIVAFDADGNEVTELPVEAEEISQAQVAAVASAEPVMTQAEEPLGAPAPAPAPAAPPTLYLYGPREMWYFDGETPAGYLVSTTVRSNRGGGAFSWFTSSHLTLSSPAAARPVVTTANPSTASRDAMIGLRHTAADGTVTRASYALTVRAPDHLVHTGTTCNADATWGYDCRVSYTIDDNFNTTLPSNVPVNEHWLSAAPVADFAGMDWRRGGENGVVVPPTGLGDHIQGETAGHTPAPVGPTHADAAVAVYHWPGEIRCGSTSIGVGRIVRTLTWQKNRGNAGHI